MTTIPVATRTPYDVLIGANLLPSVGTYIAQVKQPCRVLVISDDRVFPLYGETVKTSFENAGFTVLTMEKQKGFRAHLVARKMKRIDFETEP